jgi:thiol:disulfide interchange protein
MRRILGIGLIAGVLGCLSFINNDEALEASIERADEAKGIQFQPMTLEAAKEKAKETGKLIFIDVHASWCGPCKMMARGPFKDEKVGKIYNENFINLKIDAEKDPDGEFVSRAYAVSAYPTLLFVDAKGKLVKSYVGYRSEEMLMGMATGLIKN